MLFGFILAVLAAIAALLYRRRLTHHTTAIDDDVLRAIEEHGRVEVDEPLDIEHIREEERRFLEEERWDEAEDW